MFRSPYRQYWLPDSQQISGVSWRPSLNLLLRHKLKTENKFHPRLKVLLSRPQSVVSTVTGLQTGYRLDDMRFESQKQDTFQEQPDGLRSHPASYSMGTVTPSLG
jgi:hypothetical protein